MSILERKLEKYLSFNEDEFVIFIFMVLLRVIAVKLETIQKSIY